MSRFKDTVKKDIGAVFINPEEFGDKHILNDKEVVCIVDENETNEAKKTVSSPIEGVFVNRLTIYVKTSDMDAKPVVGEPLYLDDEMYLVNNVSDEMGVLAITVGVHEQ